MNILVTGGLGFIGSHTVISLLAHGYDVCILDNLDNSDRSVLDRLEQISERSLPFQPVDLRDRAALRKSLATFPKIEGTIHFAAYKSVSESMRVPHQYYQNNMTGMLNLLECLSEIEAYPFIFSSSCTVYGEPEAVPVSENTPKQKAESPYGHTKLLGEDILANLTRFSPLRAIALRYFNPIGAHPSTLIGELPKGVPDNLVPYITQTAIGKRDQLQIFGSDYNTPDGTAIRDFIHVCDLGDAHVQAMNYLTAHPDVQFDAFNIGTGRGASVLELVKTFEAVNQLELPYRFADRRPGDISEIYADPSKAEQVLGWSAQRSLADALKSAWAWEKALAGM
jgi:UDP-glucose 4-epimerase